MKDELLQGTDEWKASRVGRVGCSRLGDVLAEGRTKGQPSATRRNYMADLLCERLTGEWTESFYSDDMRRGIEMEPFARSEYEARNGVMVITDGGREHPTIKGFGCSPDGLVGDDGGIEIKCPKKANHLDTFMNGTVKLDYIYQMAGAVIIYDRAWWDFVSYHPSFPENLRLFQKRFYREDLPIQKVTDGVVRFLAELEELENKVRSLEL